MSNPLPIVIVASLLAGGAGAVATTALSKKPANAATSEAVMPGGDDLLAAVRSLESSQQELIDRLARLEAGAELASVGMAAPGPRVSAGATELDIEEAVEKALASMDAKESTAVTPRFAKMVDAAIELRDERRQQERDAERAEAAVKRLEDRLAKLQTDLGLDQGQVNSMRSIYQDRDVKRDEMRTEMRSMRDAGGSWEDMRSMWKGLTDETNTSIQGVLTAGQYETYQETNQDDRFGRGGRGGGGGGDNGGGGGGGGGRGGGGGGGGRGGR